MWPTLPVLGTELVSTTLIHGVDFMAAEIFSRGLHVFVGHAAANRFMNSALSLLESAVLRAPLLKSAIVWTKYSTGSPEMLVFSERPLPFG